MSESRDLSRPDCLALLAAHSVGRVAVTTPEGPHIVPVSYTVLGDSVVVRTSAYSLLGTYARDAVIALEVDDVEPGSRRGWSVVVRGTCSIEGDPRTIRAIREAAADTPWAAGTRNLYLRVRTDQVSGRSFGDPSAAQARRALESLGAPLEGSPDAYSGI